jgi:protein-disulfide isomerase
LTGVSHWSTNVSNRQERRKAREEGASDTNRFNQILILVAVLGIGAVGWSVSSSMLGTAVAEPIEVEGLDDMATLAEVAQGTTRGDPDAPFTIIEFGDYQCPGCGGFALTVKPGVDQAFIDTGIAKFVFYDFPLPMHPHAFLAARAARCAGDQDKYWEYHDQLFRNQVNWSGRVDPVSAFLGYGEAISLEQDTFERCLKSEQHAEVVSANIVLGQALGVTGTPTILVEKDGDLRPLMTNSLAAIEEAIQLMTPASEPTGN